MALSLLHLVLLTLLPTLAFSTLNIRHQKYPNGMKSIHFTLYEHDTVNKTAYFIVKGVAGPTKITTASNPFGSLIAYHDPLTATSDPSSLVLGTVEGSCVTSSFDGERTTCLSSFNLNLEGYKGQLLNVGVAYFIKNSELPMSGGTGDFRFVQGYITASAVSFTGPTILYKIDFNLYWPPFAALLIKS